LSDHQDPTGFQNTNRSGKLKALSVEWCFRIVVKQCHEEGALLLRDFFCFNYVKGGATKKDKLMNSRFQRIYAWNKKQASGADN
jgi:hypothetical protein